MDAAAVAFEKDKDRDKYVAIGESDRMTPRFVKAPAKAGSAPKAEGDKGKGDADKAAPKTEPKADPKADGRRPKLNPKRTAAGQSRTQSHALTTPVRWASMKSVNTTHLTVRERRALPPASSAQAGDRISRRPSPAWFYFPSTGCGFALVVMWGPSILMSALLVGFGELLRDEGVSGRRVPPSLHDRGDAGSPVLGDGRCRRRCLVERVVARTAGRRRHRVGMDGWLAHRPLATRGVSRNRCLSFVRRSSPY